VDRGQRGGSQSSRWLEGGRLFSTAVVVMSSWALAAAGDEDVWRRLCERNRPCAVTERQMPQALTVLANQVSDQRCKDVAPTESSAMAGDSLTLRPSTLDQPKRLGGGRGLVDDYTLLFRCKGAAFCCLGVCPAAPTTRCELLLTAA